MRSLKHPEIARVPWRRLGQWSVWVLVAAIVIYVNRLPQLLLNYTDDVAAEDVLRHSFHFADFRHGALSGGCGPAAGLAWFFLERAFGPGRIALDGLHGPSITGMRSSWRFSARRRCWGWVACPDYFRVGRYCATLLGAAVPDGLDLLNPGAGVDRLGDRRRVFLPWGWWAWPPALIAAVCAPAVDARRTVDSLRSADGDERGDDGSVLKGRWI